MSGIYVHLPFCPYICPYCDFAKWPARKSLGERYFAALLTEICGEPPFAADTIFLGGGTPNVYSHERISELLSLLRERFGEPAECSIEVNPDLVRSGDCEAYVAAGIDRLSIGVQSFVPSEVATLGRKHTQADVENVVSMARAAGVRSVSLDLIFAVPGQSQESWRKTLASAIAMEPDHISTYGLTVEDGTPYADWRKREPAAFFDDIEEAAFYDEAIGSLERTGYEHYEVSNFAKPGHRCVHNANYWENGEYRGFGVGAASYRGGERWVQTRSLDAYQEAVESGDAVPAERERLTGAARNGEAVMLALRTAQGVWFARFQERYGVDFLEFYAPIIGGLQRDGLLEVDDRHAWLTKRGRFLANDVCGAFVTFA